jgi:hypothetical protein
MYNCVYIYIHIYALQILQKQMSYWENLRQNHETRSAARLKSSAVDCVRMPLEKVAKHRRLQVLDKARGP